MKPTPAYLRLLLVLALFMLIGCDEDVASNTTFPFPTTTNTGHTDISSPALDFVLGIEGYQQRKESAFYGKITRVEPILDNYGQRLVDGKLVDLTECPGDETEIIPALRLHMELERATWDTKGESKLVVSVPYDCFLPVQARMTGEKGKVRWSDGENYFSVGTRFGSFGRLDKNGVWNIGFPLFVVDDDDTLVFEKELFYAEGSDGHEKFSREDLEGTTFAELEKALHLSYDDAHATYVMEEVVPLVSECGPEFGDPFPTW